MDTKIPLNRNECRADKLRPGTRIAAGFLPLHNLLPRRGAAEILFAYPYRLHGHGRVCVVYLYDGDGQPATDDFLADALIPVTSMPVTPGCVFGDGQSERLVSTPCDDYPLCVCTPTADQLAAHGEFLVRKSPR